MPLLFERRPSTQCFTKRGPHILAFSGVFLLPANFPKARYPYPASFCKFSLNVRMLASFSRTVLDIALAL